jgi:hypothetical protein
MSASDATVKLRGAEDPGDRIVSTAGTSPQIPELVFPSPTKNVTGAASARPVGRAEQGRFDSISARAGGGVVAAAATRTEGGVGSLPAGWYERATSLIN